MAQRSAIRDELSFWLVIALVAIAATSAFRHVAKGSLGERLPVLRSVAGVS